MLNQAEIKLAKMLRSVSVRADLRSIVLYHVVGSKIGEQLWSTEVLSSGAGWANDVARQIYEAAEADFTGQGVQTYVVRAFIKDSEKGIARVKFTISETDSEDSDEMMSEPATKAGLVSQSMRHTEQMTQLATRVMGASLEHLARQNEILSRQLIAVTEKNAAMMQDMEEVLTLKHERQVELVKEEARAKAIASLGDGVKALLPHIASKLTGQPMVQAKAMALLQSITPDQLQRIASAGIFDHAQIAAALELFQGGDQPANNGDH